MLCSFAVATAEFVLVGLLPRIAADLAVSMSAAGQLVTAYMLVVTVGGPAATSSPDGCPGGPARRHDGARHGAAVGSALAGTYACCSSRGSGPRSRRRCSWRWRRRSRWPPCRADLAADRRGGQGVRRVRARHRHRPAAGYPGRSGLRVARHVRRRRGAGPRGHVGVLVFCPPIPAVGSGEPGRGEPQAAGEPAVSAGSLVTCSRSPASWRSSPTWRRCSARITGSARAGSASRWSGTGEHDRGQRLAGRVPTAAIARLLPLPVAVWPWSCLRPASSCAAAAALVGLVVLGAATFIVVPLLQTWLMGGSGSRGRAWSPR